ncbi:thiamine-phosphate kinase [Micromonospora chersina]
MFLRDLGEKEFLAGVLPGLPRHEAFLNGFGDDAAVLNVPISRQERLVFKVDRAAQPIATRRGWADNTMWGRLAVTATCSDILAAGAQPQAFMLACIFPPDFGVAEARAVIEGCASECAKWNVAFVGGDTKEGPSAEIVGAGIGVTTGPYYLGRRGGMPGDALVLAGRLGGYLGAYTQLVEDVDSTEERSAEWVSYVSHPTAQWEAAAIMNASQVATAAMDCSDGLYDALSVLSGEHGCEIDESLLPYHPSALQCHQSLGVNPLSLALGVGDWNIVYVVPESQLGALFRSSEHSSRRLTVIGRIADNKTGEVRIKDAEGRLRRLRRVINEHFVMRQEDEGSSLDMVKASPYGD